MENPKIRTVDEAVELAKVKLLQISLPAGLSRSVGLPINEAIDLLQAVQDAWAREDAAQQAQEEPEIIIEPIAEEEAGEA